LEQTICDLTKELENLQNENETKLHNQIEDSQFVKELRDDITNLTKQYE
jgi:pentose-5-phosphate-3-epimerase